MSITRRVVCLACDWCGKRELRAVKLPCPRCGGQVKPRLLCGTRGSAARLAAGGVR